jgi:ubiquinone biosynthesis protein UbiJ
MDHSVDSPVLLTAEIETLMIRLLEMDPDAVTRLERLLSKMRVRRAVEKRLA